MIKDLMHAIFNEDVDIEEEMDIESSESTATYVEPQIQPMGNVAPQFTKIEVPIVQEEVRPIKKTKSSFFEGLDVDDISLDAPTRTKNAYSFDRKRLKQANRKNEEVEYQQIISPIFGNTEESKKEFDKIHDAISLSKPENDEEGFSQIISPMYGASIPNQQKKVISKRIEKPEKEVSYTLKDMLEKPKKQVNQQANLFSSKD